MHVAPHLSFFITDTLVSSEQESGTRRATYVLLKSLAVNAAHVQACSTLTRHYFCRVNSVTGWLLMRQPAFCMSHLCNAVYSEDDVLGLCGQVLNVRFGWKNHLWFLMHFFYLKRNGAQNTSLWVAISARQRARKKTFLAVLVCCVWEAFSSLFHAVAAG